jgi:hypothetical protein
MLSEARTGVITSSDGAVNPLRSNKVGALVTANSGSGKYAELSKVKKIFFAANQADTTWTVALATTFTGIVVSNPIGSGVNLSILRASFALSVAPAGVATMGFLAGWSSAGITTHTTPLTPYSTYIGSNRGQGLADAAATLVGTPVWVEHFMGGFTAGALPSTSPSVIDTEGMYTVPPGGYFGIGALTVVHGMASIAWEEIDI